MIQSGLGHRDLLRSSSTLRSAIKTAGNRGKSPKATLQVVKIEQYPKVVKSEQYLKSRILYDFLIRSGGITVRDGFELLSLVEEDIKWLGDAAKRFEELARQLDEPEKSKWGLLAAVYQERAKVHQELVEKLRDGKQPTLGRAQTSMRGESQETA